jgi:antitoxin component HigA of HigAB toxin-antitoxin module
MEIKVIKTRSEYDEAIEQLSKLMDKNPAPGSDDENLMELLILVIKDYEQKNVEPVGSLFGKSKESIHVIGDILSPIDEEWDSAR